MLAPGTGELRWQVRVIASMLVLSSKRRVSYRRAAGVRALNQMTVPVHRRFHRLVAEAPGQLVHVHAGGQHHRCMRMPYVVWPRPTFVWHAQCCPCLTLDLVEGGGVDLAALHGLEHQFFVATVCEHRAHDLVRLTGQRH